MRAQMMSAVVVATCLAGCPTGVPPAPAPIIVPPVVVPDDDAGVPDADAGVVDAGVPVVDAGPPAYVCPPRPNVPHLGLGHSELSEEMAQAWLDYRAERDAERFAEAKDPAAQWAHHRVEQVDIDHGCYALDDVVDVGRALFTRRFRLEEGFGNDLDDHAAAGAKPRPNMRRFQAGAFGGPDATSCLNCHWKQGLGGSGDRADNSFLFGDGDDVTTHDERNPPPLWGLGWVEVLAQEMSADLQRQRDEAVADFDASDETTRRVPLTTQGISFGQLLLSKRNARVHVDTSDVEGVDGDLVIKPFGYKGVFPELRDFLMHSLQVHLGMQAEEVLPLVASGAITDLDLGNGPADDPDDDGVERELTEGQLTALQVFLATQDVPVVDVPGPEDFAIRWAEGAELFEGIGCAYCHVPFLKVAQPTYEVHPTLSGSTVRVDLQHGARPLPSTSDDGGFLIPVFSDFKRHHMGDRLPAQHAERGVEADVFLTRRLMAVAQTGPWMHTAAAATFDEAIYLHGGEGSEAKGASDAFFGLTDDEKGAIRVFLDSLRRAPSIRIR